MGGSASKPVVLKKEHVTSALKDGMVFRFLKEDDDKKGYFELLAQLTPSPPVAHKDFAARVLLLRNSKAVHTVVLEDIRSKRIIGTGTIVIEPKFIHGNGHVGHIEDVVVDKNSRNAHVGRRYAARMPVF